MDLACGERLVELGDFDADRAEVEVLEAVLPRPVLHRGDAQDRGDGDGGAVDLGERRLHRRTKRGNVGFLIEDARDLGAGDHQRGAKVVGDVVADGFELVEQALDLVQHQVDCTRHLFDVVAFISDRQARVKLAVHDADDRAVNPFEASRGAKRKHCADRHNCENRR